MSNFDPTPEQQHALDLFATGESMVIEAGAGTGKTSTLIMLAESAPERRGQYVAFNRAIVDEAAQKFPSNVACNTAHSLAMRAVGKKYRHRLNSGRVKPWELARKLDVRDFVVTYGSQKKTLQSGFLAGLVMKGITNFCHTADEKPTRWHIPYVDGIDIPDVKDGARTYKNNDRLRDQLEDALARAWKDIQDPDGTLPFQHDHYLKIWQLSNPVLDLDFIMLDEAQDANPVIAAIIEAQTCQRVYVGDSQQQIYEFTGAVNAMNKIDAEHRAFLTQSFRFGPAVADVANMVLSKIPSAELRLSGFEKIDSRVGVFEPDAVLCRTNAKTVEITLKLLELGRRPHLVGGGREIAAFARGAQRLMNGEHASHPDLACFDTWEEVQTYVQHDPQGSDLYGMVKLIDDFSIDVILAALDGTIAEKDADVIVSTAHKAKGREWDHVRIENDFPPEIQGDAEFRLLYVAVTRAKLGLDDRAVRHHYVPGEAAEGVLPAGGAPIALPAGV
jgi:superfamily I DNA/RNA helicase